MSNEEIRLLMPQKMDTYSVNVDKRLAEVVEGGKGCGTRNNSCQTEDIIWTQVRSSKSGKPPVHNSLKREITPIPLSNKFDLLHDQEKSDNAVQKALQNKETERSYTSRKNMKNRQRNDDTKEIKHNQLRTQKNYQPKALVRQKVLGDGRVLVIADSHGRELNRFIQEQTFLSVTTFSRPNATFDQVTHDLDTLTESFTKQDYVVVIGGTNDIETKDAYKLPHKMADLSRKLENTNLIIATLSLRHDNPFLDGKISEINDQIISLVDSLPSKPAVLPLHDLPRHLYTTHGLHFNRKGKEKIGKFIIGTVQKLKQKNKHRSVLAEGGDIRIVEEDMSNILSLFENDESCAFAHCISSDIEHMKNMSAGVAVAFRNHHGRPQESNILNKHITYQQVNNGAGIYGLMTKSKYYDKPKIEDYDKCFSYFLDDFKKRKFNCLICSPMGCVRDGIPIEKFVSNIVKFHQITGAAVNIVTHNEKSSRTLYNGLSFSSFLSKLQHELDLAKHEMQDVNFHVTRAPGRLQPTDSRGEDLAVQEVSDTEAVLSMETPAYDLPHAVLDVSSASECLSVSSSESEVSVSEHHVNHSKRPDSQIKDVLSSNVHKSELGNSLLTKPLNRM